MVEFAKSGLTDSMQPWFDAQFQSTQAMASSIDYILSFISSEAGRCVLRDIIFFITLKNKACHL
jgi:hypothetical protein